MEISNQHLNRYVWVLPVTMLIFFFNSFLLPEGLTMTLLLTPVWVYVLHKHDLLKASLVIILPIILFSIIHLLQGVELRYLLISFTMLSCMVFFLLASYLFISDSRYDWDRVFRTLAIANFLFAFVSLFFLWLPSLKSMVWYMVPISNNVAPVPRLKLFTSEASHYSFWVAPIAIYFYTRALLFPSRGIWFTLALVTFPLIISFSLGVWAGIILSGIPIFAWVVIKKISNPKRIFGAITVLFILLIVLFAAYKLFPQNPLFARLDNIISGKDTSANGRTFEAFVLANKIVSQKSYLFGIGLGQLKVIGRQIIIQFYHYITVPSSARIPNACAETIVYFGYIGFAIRMTIEIALFFVTRVYQNPYRLWVFLFVFIYQFTGSFITNVAEYLVWIVAFSPIFPELIRNRTSSVTSSDKTDVSQ